MPTMDIHQVLTLAHSKDFASLWRDLITKLPACKECGCPSSFVWEDEALREYYLCARCMGTYNDPTVDAKEWHQTAWHPHVLAFELGRLPPERP